MNTPLEIELVRRIGSFLKARSTPLKAESVRLFGRNQDDFLEILPFMCSQSVEELYFSLSFLSGIPKHQEPMKIDKIVELDHWKQAKNLCIVDGKVSAPIQNFEHFNKVDARIEPLTTDTIKYLREIFLNSSSPTKCFGPLMGLDEDHLTEVLGQCSAEIKWLDEKTWFFKNWQNPELVLKISNNYPMFVNVLRKDVPENLRIYDV